MSQIVGAAAPISGSGDGGGSGGGGSYTNPAATPGTPYSWEGALGGVKVANGNKLTSVGIVSWTQRGGLPVGLSLNHNSQSSRNGELGPKWLMSYDDTLSVDGSGNVTVYWDDGRVYTFMMNVNGTYTPPAGIYDSLAYSHSNRGNYTTYFITTKNQTQYRFDGIPVAGFGNSATSCQLTSVADENGNYVSVNYRTGTSTTGYTTGTLVQSVSDITGRTITLGYTNSKLTSVTDPLNRQWTLSYDGNGRLAHVYWPLVNGNRYSVNLGYDSNNNVTSYQDMRSNTATFGYSTDGTNTLSWEQDAAGNRTTFAYGYDSVRNVSNVPATTVTDANNHNTVYYIGTSGQVTAIYDALTYSESYAYDSNFNVKQKQDRRQQTWNYTYDAMGNILTAADPYGNTSTLTYNAHSKVLTAQLPSSRSAAIIYDASDNPIEVDQKNAAGTTLAITKLTIGNYGLVSDKYDPNGHHTGYTYDANGYLNSTTTPLGHQTQWAYDALGFQTSRTDAMGRTTTYTPDAWERLTTLTYPDSTTRTYGYDPNGNLTSFNNAVVSITRSYDADNRLLADYYSGVRAVSHTYDAAGQNGMLSTTTDFLGNVHAFTYTARNQLSQASIPGQTVSYIYDPNGNQSNAYLPNGLRTDTYYLANNWRSSVYNVSNTTGAVLSAYDCAFNADGQIIYTLEGHSTNPSTNNETTENFGYDGLGHLTSEVRNGTAPENISYAYDAAGNRVSQSGSALNGTLSYDADDELTGFTYSGASYASATFGYDANGERTTETTGLSASGGGYGTQYGYDFEGNLTGISAAGSSPVSFEYDGLDRQVGWQSGGTQLDYQLDGDVPLTETNQTSSWVNFYGNGLVSTAGETLLSDGLGATCQTTNSSQSVVWSGTYTAFGQPIALSGGTGNHYQWGAGSGYRSDGFGPANALPLTKVGCRYYDPEFGCFMTRDTDLSQFPYAYCAGDPVNFKDRSGHEFSDDAGAAGVFGGIGLAGGIAGAGAGLDGGFLVALAAAGPTGGLSLGLYAAAALVILGAAIIIHNHPIRFHPPKFHPVKIIIPIDPTTGYPMSSSLTLSPLEIQGLFGFNNFSQNSAPPSKSGGNSRNY